MKLFFAAADMDSLFWQRLTELVLRQRILIAGCGMCACWTRGLTISEREDQPMEVAG